MAIQWFPGHMTSARKKAAESMERIDVVIEVLDARLRKAAKEVCGLSQPDLPASEWESARQCFAKSLAAAGI